MTVSTHAKYPGVVTEKSGCHTREIEKRKASARLCFLRMIAFFKRKDLPTNLKMAVYSSTVRAVLLYGAGSWRLTKAEFKTLDAVDRSFQRRVVRGWRFRPDGSVRCISNKKLSKLSRQEPLTRVIRQARLRWIGHVARMDGTRPPKQALELMAESSRRKKKRGGQRKSYLRLIKEDLALQAWSPRQILRYVYKKAKDRRTWKTHIN